MKREVEERRAVCFAIKLQLFTEKIEVKGHSSKKYCSAVEHAFLSPIFFGISMAKHKFVFAVNNTSFRGKTIVQMHSLISLFFLWLYFCNSNATLPLLIWFLGVLLYRSFWSTSKNKKCMNSEWVVDKLYVEKKLQHSLVKCRRDQVGGLFEQHTI